jgi:hypothetical protein
MEGKKGQAILFTFQFSYMGPKAEAKAAAAMMMIMMMPASFF